MNPAFYIRKQHTFSLCMNKTDGIKTNKIADIDVQVTVENVDHMTIIYL